MIWDLSLYLIDKRNILLHFQQLIQKFDLDQSVHSLLISHRHGYKNSRLTALFPDEVLICIHVPEKPMFPLYPVSSPIRLPSQK